MKRAAALSAWLLLAGIAAGQAAPEAPDGRRGFGLEVTQRGIFDLWRSKDAADRAFLDELVQVSNQVRTSVALARASISDRGYFQLLPASAGDDLARLLNEYASASAAPAKLLAPGDSKSRALAGMLLDARFNARAGLLAEALVALRELDRARAALGGTVDGWVSFSEPELANVAARADLAAAELRALRVDLDVLRPGLDGARDAAAEAAAVERLLEIARIPDETMRANVLHGELAPRRELQAKLTSLLSSERLRPKLTALRNWRARMTAAGDDLRAKTLQMLPDTSEGSSVSGEIARMGKTNRYRAAYELARQGLASDPLDPELAWAAGHAAEFPYPGREGIPYFDRYLALVGVRAADPRPAGGRELTKREQEALTAVQAYNASAHGQR